MSSLPAVQLFRVRGHAVLVVGLLLILLSPIKVACQTDSSGGTGRFSELSSCLGAPNATSVCVRCDTTVTVRDGGSDCSRDSRSLRGRECSRLEDVVESIAMMETMHGPGSCIKVVIWPRAEGESHVVLARGGRELTQNVVLAGRENDEVS